MGERLLRHYAGIVYEELCGEIIGSVDDEIIVGDKLVYVFTGNKCTVGLDGDIGVYSFHCLLCGLHLCLADIGGGVDYLALEIGEVDLVRISDTDSSHACCRKIHCRRCAQTACTDYEHLGVKELLLSLCADFLEYDVS